MTDRDPATKPPHDVVHEVTDLEAYLDRMLEAERMTFDDWYAMFGQGFYRARNETILGIVRQLRPSRIFEFACAGGFLAELLVAEISEIEQYLCSSFSTRMIERVRVQLRRHSQCEVRLVDVDVHRSTDFRRDRLTPFNLFLTTSFEHIQFDRELIRELPVNAHFVFSVALFDDPEHFRVFQDEEQIRRRYQDLLDIEQVVIVGDRAKGVVASRVKSHDRRPTS